MAATQTALEGLRARDVMVRDPVTAAPDLTLREFMDEVFLRHRHTAYPVTEDGATLGVISYRRVADVPREEWERLRVRDCVVPVAEALVVGADAELKEVVPKLARTPLRRALVCEGDSLLGLLSITDAARLLEAFGGPGRRTGRRADVMA